MKKQICSIKFIVAICNIVGFFQAYEIMFIFNVCFIKKNIFDTLFGNWRNSRY